MLKQVLRSSSAVAIAALVVMPVAAQQTKTETRKSIDPSGSWRWTDDFGIESVLKLEAGKDGKLKGTYVGHVEKPTPVEGKIDGDKLEIEFAINHPEAGRLSIHTAGIIDGDEVAASIEWTGGDFGGAKVNMVRSVQDEDVVGVWNLKFADPRGEEHSPALTIKQVDKKLQAVWANGELETRSVKLEDNHLNATLGGTFNGREITLGLKARPYGSKLKGKLEINVANFSGEVDVTGVRKTDEKQASETDDE